MSSHRLQVNTLLGNSMIRMFAYSDLGTCSHSPLRCPIEEQEQGHHSHPGKHGNKMVADFLKGQRWLMGGYTMEMEPVTPVYIVYSQHHI